MPRHCHCGLPLSYPLVRHSSQLLPNFFPFTFSSSPSLLPSLPTSFSLCRLTRPLLCFYSLHTPLSSPLFCPSLLPSLYPSSLPSFLLCSPVSPPHAPSLPCFSLCRLARLASVRAAPWPQITDAACNLPNWTIAPMPTSTLIKSAFKNHGLKRGEYTGYGKPWLGESTLT